MGLRRLLTPFFIAALALTTSCAACDDDPGPGTKGDVSIDMESEVGVDMEMPEDMPADMPADMGGDMPVDAGDMADGGVSDVVEIVTCGGSFDAPTGDGLCDATAATDATSTLIQGREVLAGNTIYENGAVQVDHATGKISCVGCDCMADQQTTVVTCADGVVSPSLINTHDHITFSLSRPQTPPTERFEHRHDWRRGLRGHSEVDTFPGRDSSTEGVLYGELRMLFGGATSVAGSGGADGLLRNLDRASNLEGLVGVDVDYSTFPLGDSGGQLLSTGCNYPDVEPSSVLNSGIYLPHIAEGIDEEARNEFSCLSGAATGGRDLVEANTSIIHGIGLTVTDIAEIAANGAKLVWSPRSNISLYGNTARVPLFKHYGITIALGTDWSASGSMNMLRELKCADYLNSTHYDALFTDHELWQMATFNAAVAMGADRQIGLLKDDYVADIAIFDGTQRDRYRAVIAAETADVAAVLRGGEPLYGDANIVEALVPSSDVDQCETMDVCGESRRICAELDTGMTIQDIKDAVDSAAYELFFCDTPTDEPTCIPSREGEYSGDVTADDADGDGIVDADDLCPATFTPVRPLDGSMQPDFDDDMLGDDCDACPLEDTDMCEAFDPDDRDADGVANVDDNCPGEPNMNQEDGDNDGIGDICDPCPAFDNTDTLACPSTVYDIRDGTTGLGSIVFIEDVIVTGVGDRAFFVQVPSSSPDYNGLDFSGLFVFNGSMPTVSRGDIIRVEGTVAEFGGETQLSNVTDVQVISSGNTLPAVTDVTPSQIATGGADADRLRGTLVRVSDVTVTDANPDGPNNDFGEFEVDDALRVDDELHAIMPDPIQGDEFAALTGILHFSFGDTKLEPRDSADVVTGPPSLVGLDPAKAYLESGSMMVVPTPTLEIVLSGPTLMDTDITMGYSGNVSGPGTITIPMGDSSATVPLTPGAGTMDGTVTATLDTDSFTTDIVVYDDASQRTVLSVSPQTLTLPVNNSGTATVTIEPPAPMGGQDVDIALTPGTNASAMTPLTIPAGALSADVTVDAGANAGTETLTASIGTSSKTATVDVVAGIPDCLIISEYIEGSGLNNKAIELYNCSPGDLSLDEFGVCLISNDNTTCNAQTTLAVTTLAVQDVWTVCKTTSGSSGDPVDGIKNNCDEEASSTINFNGDDRLIIFKDEDGDGSFDATNDLIVDAFGETAVRPSNEPWKDKTLRRCDFTQHDGTTAFDASTLYTEHSENDATDYGTPPTEGCP